jgi:hypothetical protein
MNYSPPLMTVPSNMTPAGTQTPEPGTNFQAVREYQSLFTGPNGLTQYHDAYSAWTRRLRINDRGGLYFHFALRTSAGFAAWTHNSATLFRAFRQACEQVTLQAFPHFSKSHPQRHPADQSFGMIVVPAISASGMIHDHGWIRVPVTADVRPCDFDIDENNRPLTISGPTALGQFVSEILFSPHSPYRGRGTSLWIHHVDRQAQCDTQSDPDPGLTYLRKVADGELRQWANAEHVPHLVFRRLYQTVLPSAESGPFTPSRLPL